MFKGSAKKINNIFFTAGLTAPYREFPIGTLKMIPYRDFFIFLQGIPYRDLKKNKKN